MKSSTHDSPIQKCIHGGWCRKTDQLNYATTFEVRSVAQEMYADIGIDPAAAVTQWLE